MQENGKSRSSFEVFCLTGGKKFLGTTSKIQNFGILETFLHVTFFLRFFCLSSEKLLEEPSNASDSFKRRVSKKLMQKKVISRHSVENFLSQSAEKFR